MSLSMPKNDTIDILSGENNLAVDNDVGKSVLVKRSNYLDFVLGQPVE